jgi:hypothetical protein
VKIPDWLEFTILGCDGQSYWMKDLPHMGHELGEGAVLSFSGSMQMSSG